MGQILYFGSLGVKFDDFAFIRETHASMKQFRVVFRKNVAACFEISHCLSMIRLLLLSDDHDSTHVCIKTIILNVFFILLRLLRRTTYFHVSGGDSLNCTRVKHTTIHINIESE